MKCGIINCVQSDNRFLWRCHGTCNRTFHAACVGAQRNHEDILRTFMLPLCQDCQDQFITEFNLKALTKSLNGISENIGNSLEANHKLQQNFKNLSATHDDALEHIEKMLNDIKYSISNVASSNKLLATEMKNAISSHLDTPSDTCTAVEVAAKSAATAAVAAITKTTSHSINQLPQLITTLKNDLAKSHASLACDVMSHMEELAKTKSTTHTTIPNTYNILESELQNVTKEPTSSWRIVGSKKIWKRDWTEFDARQHSRRLQEKKQEKAIRRRKQRKRHHQKVFNHNHNNMNKVNNYNNATIDNNTIHNSNNTNNNNTSNNINNNNINNGNGNITRTPLPLDKELLAAARIQFSGPPSNDSIPKFINFQKGETINPYRTEKPDAPLLDPMRPPVVRLTEQSAAGDRRFLKARLRDPKIMDTVRTYLSFLHNQPPSVCVRGITKISSTLMLAAEGLPTDTQLLREIFLDVHEELGIPRIDALADLESHRAFLSSERTQRLQHTREAAYKFYSTQNFHRH